MAQGTSAAQRQEFYRRHEVGQSYQEIAKQMGVSQECVRYWCRRQRDGQDVQSRYRREAPGLLNRFEPKVRYVILRLRLEHPRWGPNRILFKLKKRLSLKGLTLPSETQIGRYLHQWPRFQRRRQVETPGERPQPPTAVHQRWQLDFKMGIALRNESLVNLHTVRDPVGEACLGAIVFAAGQVGQAPRKVTAAEARTTLRRCFARWRTLPAEVQTDGETTLVHNRQGDFPTLFTLWLTGLGIVHKVIRPGRPTDNAEVERCHRTVTDYAIVGNEKADLTRLQTILEEAVDELNFELPSQAQGCAGRSPIQAHPDLLQPLRPFQPEQELAHFDLGRIDTYLATFTWHRIANKVGQVSLSGRRYLVAKAFAYRSIPIRFDPVDRHFVFFDPNDPERQLKRRPAKGLELDDLTGLASWPIGLGPQQLPLPLFSDEKVNF